jgi:hypothetical protein
MRIWAVLSSSGHDNRGASDEPFGDEEIGNPTEPGDDDDKAGYGAKSDFEQIETTEPTMEIEGTCPELFGKLPAAGEKCSYAAGDMKA